MPIRHTKEKPSLLATPLRALLSCPVVQRLLISLDVNKAHERFIGVEVRIVDKDTVLHQTYPHALEDFMVNVYPELKNKGWLVSLAQALQKGHAARLVLPANLLIGTTESDHVEVFVYGIAVFQKGDVYFRVLENNSEKTYFVKAVALMESLKTSALLSSAKLPTTIEMLTGDDILGIRGDTKKNILSTCTPALSA